MLKMLLFLWRRQPSEVETGGRIEERKAPNILANLTVEVLQQLLVSSDPLYLCRTVSTYQAPLSLQHKTLNELDHEMVAPEAIKVENKARLYPGPFGGVCAGRLDGIPALVAVKTLKPKGDQQARLRVEVVSCFSKTFSSLSHV